MITAPHLRTSSKSIPSGSLSLSLDTNLSHSTESQLPSPSKDKEKIRQWVFPRGGGGSSPPHPAREKEMAISASGSVWDKQRTGSNSSITTEPLPSVPLPPPRPIPESRHKLNTSIAYSSSHSSSHSSFLHSLSRKSPQELIYGMIFLFSLLTFFSALTGTGYSPSSASSSLTPSPRARAWPKVHDPTDVEPAIDIPIPAGFLPRENKERAPADVHRPEGDSSHDTGMDMMRDSPDDPGLDDENVHEVQERGKQALFAKRVNGEDQVDHKAETHKHSEVDPSVDAADADDDEDDDEDDEEEAHPALNTDAMPHEDSFLSHPAPASPPPPASEDELELETEQQQQRLGDSYRRPSTPEGINQLKKEREKIVRERERWLADVREAEKERAAKGEKGEREVEALKRRQRIVR